jgi:hypothetical protein
MSAKDMCFKVGPFQFKPCLQHLQFCRFERSLGFSVFSILFNDGQYRNTLLDKELLGNNRRCPV